MTYDESLTSRAACENRLKVEVRAAKIVGEQPARHWAFLLLRLSLSPL
jgi:hypothetical protein